MRAALRAALLSLGLLVLATAAYAAGPAYRLEVAGLACPFCAYGIEKKLRRLDGVETIEINIKDGAVIVTMEEGATLDEAVAKQAIEAAGFTLDGFERTETSISPNQD